MENQNGSRGGSTSSQTRRRVRPRIFSRSLSHDPNARRSNIRSTSENILERRLSETHSRDRMASDTSSVFMDMPPESPVGGHFPPVTSAPSVVLEQDESLAVSTTHINSMEGQVESAGTEPLMASAATSRPTPRNHSSPEIQIEFL